MLYETVLLSAAIALVTTCLSLELQAMHTRCWQAQLHEGCERCVCMHACSQYSCMALWAGRQPQDEAQCLQPGSC